MPAKERRAKRYQEVHTPSFDAGCLPEEGNGGRDLFLLRKSTPFIKNGGSAPAAKHTVSPGLSGIQAHRTPEGTKSLSTIQSEPSSAGSFLYLPSFVACHQQCDVNYREIRRPTAWF